MFVHQVSLRMIFHALHYTTPLSYKKKLNDLTECTFYREGFIYRACIRRNAIVFTSEKQKLYFMVMSEVCEILTFLLNIIYTRFGTKLFRQIMGIPMGTICTPLVADL